MLHAFRLFTGSDNASHVAEGVITSNLHIDAVTIFFQESAPHAALAWHAAPDRQFVITLSGTLEFTTRDNETFVLRPGDVLLAEDTTGSGHSWKLIDDGPWRRAYVVLKAGADTVFIERST